MDTEVIVIGAGPSGLMLAAELGLAGVPTLVVEARQVETGQSRAGGTTPRTGEVLDQRGLLEPLIEAGAVTGTGSSHFAGLPLDWQRTDTRQPWRYVPQHLLEEFLAKRLADHGIPLLLGQRLVELTQDADGVTATVETERGRIRHTARYLVGADGGHSTVRTLAGIDFPGRAATSSTLLADVVLDGPVEQVLPVGARGILDYTRRRGANWLVLLPYLGETYRLMAGPGALADRDRPVTEEEVGAVLRDTYGSTITLRELKAGSRFGNAYRQASRYNANHIYLVGDSAHIHPPMGGQGLNLGVQDAVNLGWKLAGAVAGWAPPDLLASYQAERHPVGARVLRNVKAQAALAAKTGDEARDEDVAALREILSDLLEIPAAHEAVTAMMAGTDLRYDLPTESGSAHRLIGRRLPDLDAGQGNREIRLPELLRTGRGQLLDFRDREQFRAAVAGWDDRVDYQPVTISADAFAPPVHALLVRPDGYVCWVGTSGTDADVNALASALRTWFGAANMGSARQNQLKRT